MFWVFFNFRNKKGLKWLKKCPKCNSNKTKRNGRSDGVQIYKCRECGTKFRNNRRTRTSLTKQFWKEYVFNKQTLRELKENYFLDKRTIKTFLDEYIPPNKTHNPRKINLVVDGTYFGERKEQTSWCLVVFRDPKSKENLWWTFCDTETTRVYREGREHLESLGYVILSVTGDGFGGIRQAFFDIPFQMCHVHMERLVIKGTTRNPQIEAGQVLLAIVRTLKDTDSNTFRNRLRQYSERYRDFLNEKTVHPISGEWSWTHEGLKQALGSLISLERFLFTHERNKNISRTTNSLEGHFSHIKDILEVHRGLSKKQKEKVLNSILLASSIAPSKKKLNHIL